MTRIISAMILAIFIPCISPALCVDLSGTYADCQLVGNLPEKFTFEVQQGYSHAEPYYRGSGVREGKQMSVTFVADGNGRLLLDDQKNPLGAVSLDYTAVCNPRVLTLVAHVSQLGTTAVEKFEISRSEDGGLRIQNQSLVLGQAVDSGREVVCPKK